MASYHCSVKSAVKASASSHAAWHRSRRARPNGMAEDLEATGPANLPSWANTNHPSSGPPPTSTQQASGANLSEIEIALRAKALFNPDQRQALWSWTSSGRLVRAARPPMGDPRNPGAALAGRTNCTPISCLGTTVDRIEAAAEQYFKRVPREHPELGVPGKTAPDGTTANPAPVGQAQTPPPAAQPTQRRWIIAT